MPGKEPGDWVTEQPEGPLWTCEVKLDGDGIEAVKGTRDVTLDSRRESMLNEFPHFAKH